MARKKATGKALKTTASTSFHGLSTLNLPHSIMDDLHEEIGLVERILDLDPHTIAMEFAEKEEELNTAIRFNKTEEIVRLDEYLFVIESLKTIHDRITVRRRARKPSARRAAKGGGKKRLHEMQTRGRSK
jgi:hypothetical protein